MERTRQKFGIDLPHGLLFLFFVLIFLIFFIACFGFSSLNPDLHFYLSEIVCSGPSRSLNCSRESQLLTNVFRTPENSSILLQDYGIRYISATFAKFVAVFTDRTDSLTLVIVKLYVIKSAVAAYFLTVSVYLTKRFHYTRWFALQSVICIFAFPYSLFGASSEYPATIASVAMLPILISLQIYGQEKQLTSSFHLLVGAILITGFSVVMANRFETTMFCGLAVIAHAWHRYGRVHRFRVWIPLLVYGVLLVVFASQNFTLRSWLQNLLQNRVNILSSDTAQSSVLVQVLGDAGLSAAAPLTFIDNSSRNLSNAVLPSQSRSGIIVIVLLMMFWAPLVLVVSSKLLLLFRGIVLQRQSLGLTVGKYLPGVSVVVLFVLIPYFARTIWFFQYAVPLLLVFLFSTLNLNLSATLLGSLFRVGIFSNALAFISIMTSQGSLYFGSTSIESFWIVITGLLLGVLAYMTLSLYYGRFTT